MRKTVLILCGMAVLPAAWAQRPDREGLDFLKGHTDYPELRKMLPEYCRREALALLDARKNAAASRNIAGHAQWRQSVRERLIHRLGGLPERTPLNARVTGVIDRGDYRIEKIVFESQPRFFVTASLYLPKSGQAPYPAILYPLGHEEGAKSHFAWQLMLATFAKRGYVALAWDTLGQGERVQLFDEDLKGSKAYQSTTEHTSLGAQTLLVGDALARYTIWDGMRALDYLLSRKEVDPKRVGVTGNSGGGTHSAYLAALEDRLQVAAPSCYITSWRRLLETIGPQDAEQCVPGFLAEGLDHADLVEAFAPKPYLMLSAIRDFFSITGARESYAEARGTWTALREPERMSMVEVDDGHGYNPERRLAAYKWFDQWLKKETAPEGEPDIQLSTEDELYATQTGQVNTALSSETVFTLNRERAKALRPTGANTAEIARITGYRTSASPLNVKKFGRIARSGYAIERITFDSEPGIAIPAVLYLPQGSGRRGGVVAVNGRGKAASDTDASSLAAAGYVVLSIDARGLGETRPELEPGGWSRAFGDYESAMTAILCDRTLTGMRALDIIRAVDLLAAREDVDAARIYGIGHGTAATSLLHAAALDPRLRKIGLERMLLSYRSVVENRMHQNVFEQVIPGVLKSYDLPDLVASVAPRTVWIIDAEDPMHSLIPLETVRTTYGKAAGVVRRTPQHTAALLYPFEERK